MARAHFLRLLWLKTLIRIIWRIIPSERSVTYWRRRSRRIIATLFIYFGMPHLYPTLKNICRVPRLSPRSPSPLFSCCHKITSSEWKWSPDEKSRFTNLKLTQHPIIFEKLIAVSGPRSKTFWIKADYQNKLLNLNWKDHNYSLNVRHCRLNLFEELCKYKWRHRSLSKCRYFYR